MRVCAGDGGRREGVSEGDSAREVGGERGRCRVDRAPFIATVNVSTVVTTPVGLVYLPVNVMFLPGTASMYSCERYGGDMGEILCEIAWDQSRCGRGVM